MRAKLERQVASLTFRVLQRSVQGHAEWKSESVICVICSCRLTLERNTARSSKSMLPWRCYLEVGGGARRGGAGGGWGGKDGLGFPLSAAAASCAVIEAFTHRSKERKRRSNGL